MKREFNYERSQAAGQMEAVMLVVSVVAMVGAIFAFLSYGWLPSLALLILSSMAFAVSKLFDLIGDLFGTTDAREEVAKPRPETQLPK